VRREAHNAASVLSDAYAARLRTFERAHQKLEPMLTAGHVSRQRVTLFYVGLLAGGIAPGPNVPPRVSFKSHADGRDIARKTRRRHGCRRGTPGGVRHDSHLVV
jgi:hypothetical protein